MSSRPRNASGDPAQRQLSLFEAPAAGTVPPGPAIGVSPDPAAPPQASLAPPGLAETASDGVRAPERARPGARTATAPAPSWTPVPMQHPRAQRRVVLRGHTVGYAFRRARRRSIGFVVGLDGLSVAAPRWVGHAEIEQALQAKADWILRKLQEQQERARKLEASRMVWRDGQGLPFLGETVILVLDPRVTGVQLHTEAEALPGVPRLTLHIGLPQTAAEAQVREAVQAWLQRQARRVFQERCAHYAPRLGVQPRRLSLSSASTRWGSASADGSVRLNWRLIHLALPVIDYVVVHELAHLREMNHSPAFWDVVRSVVPDYQARRDALRQDTLPSFE